MGSDLPMRWTYAGDLDDMVKLYPWPNIEASNKRALDVRLALSAVTGTPMLLNDGYLILNPACFDSLSDPNSPLRVLINQRYVRVLSRNKSPSLSLSQVVIDGAKQGIGSYRELFADKKRWTVVQKVLDPLQKDLKKENLCGWPRVNLSLSYLQLIRRLAQIPYEQRGLDVPDRIFQDVVNRFDHDLSQDPSKPRSRWEEIVKKVGQAHFQSLMQLANEVYHHNFGVAMTASPPKGRPARGLRDCRPDENLQHVHAPAVQNERADTEHSGVDPTAANTPGRSGLFEREFTSSPLRQRATARRSSGQLPRFTHALPSRKGPTQGNGRVNR